MTTHELADHLGVDRSTVVKWCIKENKTRSKKNQIKRELGKTGSLEYRMTETDAELFKLRKSPGWQKGRPRKQPETQKADRKGKPKKAVS
jgi:hypothetical protein